VPLVKSVEYVMTKVKRVTILILLLLACVGCDQTTKYTARQLLPQDDTLSLAGDTIRLQYIENAGAFLGMGASLSQGLRFWLFTVAVLLGLSGLFFYLISSSHTLEWAPAVALSLVLGGGTSNLIDRLVYKGAVVDFLNLGIGPLRTGIFNLADLAIVVGTGLLVGYFFLQGRDERSISDHAS
jgi:signal peptidase II